MASNDNAHIMVENEGETGVELEDEDVAAGTKPKVFKDGEYTDPVYKKLSRINGEINKLSKGELQKRLKDIGMDTRGVKEVLKKRLKNYYKRRRLMKAKIRPPGGTKFDYLAVIDFEATCEQQNINYRHEIIEFPIVLVDVEKMEIVESFHEYVKPVVNPRLTPFCTQLTGITQEVVDKAECFPAVLAKVEDWKNSLNLGDGKSFAVITDGPWDMFRFMYYQCKESKIDMPRWCKRWINIRKAYCNFYSCGRGGIESMLQNLGMKFEGSPHSGIDDAKNIARIAIKLLTDGCRLAINEQLQVNFNPHDAKPTVRYVPVHNYFDDDGDGGDYGDGVSGDDVRTSKKGRGRGRGRKDDIVAEFGDLSLDDTVDQHGEDIDDLISYYQLQNS